MVDLLEKEEVKATNNGDHDKFQHYFHKKAINENLLNGTPMQALCGKILAQQSDPKGKTVCPTCKEIMETIVGGNLPESERGPWAH